MSTKYRSKPVYVEAVRWQTGDEIDGVTPMTARIRFSDDRQLFYITKGDARPTFWMSVNTQPGEPTEQQKKAGFLDPGTACLTKNGQKYCRTILYFNTWSIPARLGLEEDISEKSDLFIDYGSASGWPDSVAGPPKTAFVVDGDGRRLILKSGDWIITDAAGLKRTMTDAAFHQEFERVDDGFLGVDEECVP